MTIEDTNDLQDQIVALAEQNASLKEQLIETGDQLAEYRSVVRDVVQTLGHVGGDPADLLDAVGQVEALLAGKDSLERNDLAGLAEQVRRVLHANAITKSVDAFVLGLNFTTGERLSGPAFEVIEIAEPGIEGCKHGVLFDDAAARGLSSVEVRQRWPRLDGVCPHGCGYTGIAYASKAHYVMGDW